MTVRGSERIRGALRLTASTVGLLVALTAAGVVGLAFGELVPDRWVADQLVDARADGTLTDTGRFVGRTGGIGDHFTECISLSIGLGDAADDNLATSIAAGTHLGPCNHLIPALDAYERTGRLPVGESYLRYWHGTSSVIRPALAVVDLATLRVLGYLGLIFTAIALGRRVQAAAGTGAAIGLLAPLVLTTDVLDLGTVAYHAPILAVALGSATLVLAVTSRSPTLTRGWFGGVAAGAAFVYVDLLTNVPGAWILVAAMAVLGARLAGSSPVHTFRIALVTGLGWLTGYAGMWFGKWVFAAAVLGRQRVVDDVRATIETRIDGDSPWSDHRFGAAIDANLETWLDRPLAWATLVLAGIVIVLRLRRREPAARLTVAIAAAPAVVPFVWYEVLSNHSQIHHWFTYRSLPIALGVLLLAVLTPDGAEAGRGGHRKHRRAAGGAPVA